MSFDPLETSPESSEPIELYTFAVGTFVRRYTSSEDQITTGGEEYDPIPISRTAIVINSEDIIQPVEIEVPASNEFALKWFGIPPGQEAVVFIDRLQRADVAEELNREFNGTVHSVKFLGDFQRARIGAFWTSAKNNFTIPRFTFGAQCGYVVGETDTCKVDLDLPAFKHSGAVSTQVGSVLTVNGIAGNFPDQFFTGGVVTSVGLDDRRFIMSQVGNALTLITPFPVEVLGQTVDVRAGCDHNVEGDCALKFDNVIEFGGWPFVPTKNPFKSGID